MSTFIHFVHLPIWSRKHFFNTHKANSLKLKAKEACGELSFTLTPTPTTNVMLGIWVSPPPQQHFFKQIKIGESLGAPPARPPAPGLCPALQASAKDLGRTAPTPSLLPPSLFSGPILLISLVKPHFPCPQSRNRWEDEKLMGQWEVWGGYCQGVLEI